VARKIQVTKTLRICQKNHETLLEKRWVKFQEDVDSSGRWSKPYVPSYPLSHFSLLQVLNFILCKQYLIGFFLQEQIEQGVVLLDATGQTIDEILFSQGVKHKMRMNILRQVSKTSEFQVGRMTSREGEDPIEEDENEGTSPTVRKISTASIFNMVSRLYQLFLKLLSPVA